MKVLLGILIFLISSHVCGYAQKLPGNGFDKLSIIDSSGIIKAGLIPTSEKVKLRKGLKYYWYKANRINYSQGDYAGKLLNGTYTEWYLDYSLKQKGEFTNGLKHGEWKTWYPNGKLSATYVWEHGLKSGPYRVFDKDGNATISGNYKNDELDGEITEKLQDTTLIKTYHRGRLVEAKATGFFSRFLKLNHKAKLKGEKVVNKDSIN